MTRLPQKRTLETRRRLIAAARQIVGRHGYSALRVEDVVAEAGVAKGTFFAHFADKDVLMDLLLGEEIDGLIDEMMRARAPRDAQEVTAVLMPLCDFMVRERYVFDVILRHSGAAAREEIGPIARTFLRQVEAFAQWFAAGEFRRDISPALLAEGVQAFATQAMAMHFCALHGDQPLRSRLEIYLKAWLEPPQMAEQ
ncbi:TetR/AcrR family transcriptional regulator [Breoghania sp.]|uniref:TetR/AcrR family transcriptional regulator n=1 Tax=Breoghania sp. TaxID=2065378 RepID=UPI002AAA7FEA|nr:TetR/AcrR family transcriptional regulator [Breoghania sp.]